MNLPYLPVLQTTRDVPTAVAPRVSLVQTVWKDLHPPAIQECQIHCQRACTSFQLWDLLLYNRWWRVCRQRYLTGSLASHVVPEMDTPCLGISKMNGGDEDCGFPGREDASRSAGHHVEACNIQQGRESWSSLVFHYTKSLSLSLTHRRLQGVVSSGSNSCAGLSIAVMPHSFAWGCESTALVFKGAHPR